MPNLDLSKLKIKNSNDIFIVKDSVVRRKTVTDTASTSQTVASVDANTDYHFGTLTTLTITAVVTSDYESNIYFTAGASITVNLPASLKIIGQATFEANKEYVISILNNIAVVGVIGE